MKSSVGKVVVSAFVFVLLSAAVLVYADDGLWNFSNSILSSTSSASTVRVHGGLFEDAPAGWTGNFLLGNLDGAQIFKVKFNGQATFARGVDIRSGCFSIAGVCIGIGGSGGGGRTLLTGPTTIYVSPSGSDSNDGKTPATAFATIQRAWSGLTTQDLNGQQVVIQLADGTYTNGMQASGNLVGDFSAQQVTVRGNVAHPENVIIMPTGRNPSFTAAWGAMYAIEGMKMDHHNTLQDMVMVGQYSTIAVGHVNFGYNVNPFNHITAAFLAHVLIYGSYTISGGGQTHIDAANDSSVVWPTDCNPGLFTVTVQNNPAFTAAFIFVASNAQVHVQNITFNGTARGTKFVVEGNGVIDACSSDLNYLPGDQPGIIRAGGQYLPVTKSSTAAEFGQTGQTAFYASDGTILSGTSVLQIDPAGRVGINAAPTPGVQLNIRNNEVDSAVVRVGGPSHYLQLGETGLGGEIKTVSNGIFAFGTNNVERLRISAGGNVGIGSTNPGAKLDIFGGGLKLDPGSATKPSCDATSRGLAWFTKGGTGAKDSFELCAKDAADSYAWRTLY